MLKITMQFFGGRGSTSNNTQKFELPNTEIIPSKPTKLSKTVFDREYTALRRLAEEEIAKGRYNTFGYSGLSDDDNDGLFSKPMLRGMQALINSEWHKVEINEKNNWVTPERTAIRKYALVMLNNMTNRYYKNSYGKET